MNNINIHTTGLLLVAFAALPLGAQDTDSSHKQEKEYIARSQSLYEQGQCSYFTVLDAQAALLRAEIAEQNGRDASRIAALEKNYAQQLSLATKVGNTDKALEVRQRMLTLKSRNYAALAAPFELKDTALLREYMEYHRSRYEQGLESAHIYLQSEQRLAELEKN